jgi:uncharacterized protein YkwD
MRVYDGKHSSTNLLKYVNRLRSAVQVPNLLLNIQLSSAAQAHANDLATVGYEGTEDPHSGSDGSRPLDRVERTGYLDYLHSVQEYIVEKQIPNIQGYAYIGENALRATPDYDGSAKSIIDAWEKSSGHYANIINSEYKECGFGVSIDDENRAIYVNVFGCIRLRRSTGEDENLPDYIIELIKEEKFSRYHYPLEVWTTNTGFDWSRDKEEVNEDGEVVSVPIDSLTLSIPGIGEEHLVRPFWSSSILECTYDGRMFGFLPPLLIVQAPNYTLGNIEEESVWNISDCSQDWEKTFNDLPIPPGSYFSVRMFFYIHDKVFERAPFLGYFETGFITGGLITSKEVIYNIPMYDVSIFGNTVEHIVPSDHYGCSVGEFVYLLKTSEKNEYEEEEKVDFEQGDIEIKQSNKPSDAFWYSTSYRIVPIDFFNGMHLESDLNLGYSRATKISLGWNFEQGMDTKRYDGVITEMFYSSDEAEVEITIGSRKVIKRLPILFHCYEGNSDTDGGSGVFQVGDNVHIIVPGLDDWYNAYIVTLEIKSGESDDVLRECSYGIIIKPTFNGIIATQAPCTLILNIRNGNTGEEVELKSTLFNDLYPPPYPELHDCVVFQKSAIPEWFNSVSSEMKVFLALNHRELLQYGTIAIPESAFWPYYFASGETDPDNGIYGVGASWISLDEGPYRIVDRVELDYPLIGRSEDRLYWNYSSYDVWHIDFPLKVCKSTPVGGGKSYWAHMTVPLTSSDGKSVYMMVDTPNPTCRACKQPYMYNNNDVSNNWCDDNWFFPFNDGDGYSQNEKHIGELIIITGETGLNPTFTTNTYESAKVYDYMDPDHNRTRPPSSGNYVMEMVDLPERWLTDLEYMISIYRDQGRPYVDCL